jgi:iron-sulfur cluster assembly accessory protein
MAAITVSDDAAKKIHSLIDSMNKPEHGLRVKVVGGGCSGLQYKMDLDTARDGDKIFENSGAKVLVDRKSFLYLNGTEVHYEEGLMESGFQLRNPNIKRSCGCGASFTV